MMMMRWHQKQNDAPYSLKMVVAGVFMPLTRLCIPLLVHSSFGGTGTWSRIPVPLRIPAGSLRKMSDVPRFLQAGTLVPLRNRSGFFFN